MAGIVWVWEGMDGGGEGEVLMIGMMMGGDWDGSTFWSERRPCWSDHIIINAYLSKASPKRDSYFCSRRRGFLVVDLFFFSPSFFFRRYLTVRVTPITRTCTVSTLHHTTLGRNVTRTACASTFLHAMYDMMLITDCATRSRERHVEHMIGDQEIRSSATHADSMSFVPHQYSRRKASGIG